MTEEEAGFEFALNQVFNIPLKIPSVPLIIDDGDDNVANDSNAAQEREMVDEPLIMPAAKDSDFEVLHSFHEELLESVHEEKECLHNLEPQAPEGPTPNVAASIVPPVPQQPFSNMTSDVLSQQMMYMNMLQQQIASLQAQMMAFSSQPGPYSMGHPNLGFTVPYWQQQQATTHQSSPFFIQRPPLYQLPPEQSQATPPEVQPEVQSEAIVAVAKEPNSIQTKTVEDNILEMKGKLKSANMQDTQVKVTQVAPQSQSIGTNTSFYFPLATKATPVPDQTITATEIKSDLEEGMPIVTALSHAPTDDGRNYQVFYKEFASLPPSSFSPTSAFAETPSTHQKMEPNHQVAPVTDTSACDIIASLVGDVEESFYHTGTEDESASLQSLPDTNTLFKSKKPKVKPFACSAGAVGTPSSVFKRPLIAAEIHRRKPDVLDTSAIGLDSRDSSMISRMVDTRDSSMRSETEDLSLSFATMKYLEKYGLK